MKHFAFPALVLFLASCAPGPDYVTPAKEAPEAFVSQNVLIALNKGHEKENLPADWWKGFNDPLLDKIISDALESNFEIMAATARVEEAYANVKIAGAGTGLQIDAELDNDLQERRTVGAGINNTTTTSTTGSLDIALNPDLSGRIKREVEAAQATLEGEQEALKGTVLSISSEIVQEYLTLRGNQRQLELLRESVALQEKTLTIVTERYKAGLAPDLDVQRAKTSVENLRANIPPLEENLLNSRTRLANLAGKYSGGYQFLLSKHEPIPEYKGVIPNLLPLQVLDMRPDVREAEAELKNAIAGIGIAKSDYYPSFALSGSVSIGLQNISSTPATDVIISSLGGLISHVITDGGERSASVTAAKAAAKEALANYRQALLDASEEVEQSLAAIQSSQQRQDSLQKSVQSSQKSFSQAEILYQQGLISFLDVVDAQRVLADAEQKLAAERTRYATEIAKLFEVLGVESRI